MSLMENGRMLKLKNKKNKQKKAGQCCRTESVCCYFPFGTQREFFSDSSRCTFPYNKKLYRVHCDLFKVTMTPKGQKKNNNEKAIHTILCTICEVIWRHTIALYESLSKFINATSVTHRDIWICTQASTDRIMTFALFLMQSFHMTSEDNVFGGSRQNCCMEKRWVKILFSWSMEKITSYRFGTTWRWVNNENISL